MDNPQIGSRVTTGNNRRMVGRVTAVTEFGIFVQWGHDEFSLYYVWGDFTEYALTVA